MLFLVNNYKVASLYACAIQCAAFQYGHGIPKLEFVLSKPELTHEIQPPIPINILWILFATFQALLGSFLAKG